MKRKQETDRQISFALRQAEPGTLVAQICRRMGISEPTVYRRKKKLAGMGVAEIRRPKQLEDEQRSLKQLVADLRLDKTTLQAAGRGAKLGCAERGEALPPPERREPSTERLRREPAQGAGIDQLMKTSRAHVSHGRSRRNR
jgi:putative transposase